MGLRVAGIRAMVVSSTLLVRTDRTVMTSRQLNIRLPSEDRDRLEALAFVRRTHASALARDMVLDYLKRYANEPGAEEAFAALAVHDAADAPQRNVRRLDVAWTEQPKA